MSPPTTSVTNPKSLITADNVKQVLQVDKGNDALLTSWNIVDFTKRGDNLACEVTSVEVKYSMCGQENCDVTYVVKLNPLRNFGDFQEIEPILFTKEGKFYEELVPVLNEALTSAGQEPLRLPKCFLVSLEEGKEQLYFEDLRARGFKMFDRRKGMDKYHVALVISELARLHSASYLLKEKILEGKAAASKYEFLSKDFLTFTPNSKALFVPWFQRSIDTGVMMLESIGGYENAIAFLESIKTDMSYYLSAGLQSKKVNNICHGDCWNNNILFRYDEEGHPVEVMLVDLQACREASIACDLNYFLYTSVTGDVRKPNLDHFMSVYYSAYKGVLEGSNTPMHFTEEEIGEEFRSKNTLGLLFAILVVPTILMEPEETPDFSDTNFVTLMQEFKALAMKKLKTNPLCKTRFLAVFDELMESGLIS
ncbi:uncharacterized protein LOC135225829 isoform X2 [Macrobrachium nipponense]|uniref:uncharacterized protein LOC135225829 isoform X1 n=1 Tax=Macrobrachium nipponense TaxID=159736 RepID=UPI0030C89FED